MQSMAKWVLGVSHQDITDNTGFTYVDEHNRKTSVVYAARTFDTKKEALQYLPSVSHLHNHLKPLRKASSLDIHTRTSVQTTCQALVSTGNHALAGKVLEFLEMGEILSSDDVEAISSAAQIEDE